MSQFGFTQNQVEILNFMEEITELNFSKGKNYAEDVQEPTKTKLKLLHTIITDNGQSNIKNLNEKFNSLDFNSDLKIDTYLYHLIEGYKYLNYKKNRQKSFINFNKALSISEDFNNNILKKFSLLSILSFYSKGALQGSKDYTVFLNEYKELCSSSTDWLYYYSFKFNLLGQTETYNEFESTTDQLGKIIFEKYDSLIQLNNNLGRLKYLYYRDKANHVIRKEPEVARTLYIKASTYYDSSSFFKRKWLIHYSNLYRIEILNENYSSAWQYLNKATNYISHNDSLINSYYLSTYKSSLFYKMGLHDSAYLYEKNARYLNYQINFQKENQQVAELKVKLDSEENENEILRLEAKNLKTESQNTFIKTITTILSLSILLGITIITFVIKNSRRKRLLAIQEKELETQKNITFLKEQEITSINAMVEGQEKERKRVAEDLHDNLGSVLATLKLHFENLKINREKKKINQETLFDKTEGLIDEAYLKVRSIAHAKNAGVIANQGLLVAIQMMAEKISSANAVQIEVVHFGLDKPIENSLEISLFRIIQELITNIIKHAEASQATIHISQYESNINIILEDNGKGMVVPKMNTQKGMGLHSIKTRITHLQGTFTIDSTPTKGTSILIDIPI